MQRTAICPNCGRPVKARQCGNEDLSSQYIIVKYCCPRCGSILLSERVEKRR